MTPKISIYETTYNDYMKRISQLDFQSIASELGLIVKGSDAVLSLFGKKYTISRKRITGPAGEKPLFEECVVLCKYLLLCPDTTPLASDWVNYRDLKDAGPLTVFFAKDVENKIATNFTGKPGALKKACSKLGGYKPEQELPYDISICIDALPQIPLLLLFTDADPEFPATCSILFEQRADQYLDAECLAIVGGLLAGALLDG